MKWISASLLAVALLVVRSDGIAHPGSGIVVDRQGNVYFVDTGSGVWRIDTNGTLTRLSGPAYHWMAIDLHDRLANATLPSFGAGDATVARVGATPALLLASDFPVTVGRDGSLYYPWLSRTDRLQIFRLTPSGTTTVFHTLPENTESGPLRWLNGIAAGPDGSLYYAEHRSVRRIDAQGKVTTVAREITVVPCVAPPEVDPEMGPYLRGLDVDAQGTVYVAATGCRAVLKITPGGNAVPILRAESPWSPTGVAVSGKDLYVLEYLHTPGDNRREWLPRVKRVSANGQVVTVATIDRR